MSIFKRFSITNRGLRHKLLVAFSLMTVIPLLAVMYIISTYLFPQLENIITVSMILLASLIIALLGLLLAKGLIDPVIDMAIEAKIIASGNYDKAIRISSDDEIGNLAISINVMTQKIKTNIEELKSYGQRMRDINIEIHKKVLALSSLLQIGDIISSGSMQLDSLLELIVEKAAMMFDTGFGFLYMPNDKGDFVMKVAYNLDKERLSELVLKEKGDDILEKIFDTHHPLIFDKATKMTKELDKLKTSYNVDNMLALPIFSGRRNLALLIMGNRMPDFKYRNDDIDLVKVFAKQMTIAIESDILNKRAEELAIKDDLTDLYNKSYIVSRLEEEIKRAIFYQRPCSFIVFSVDNFSKFRQLHGELPAEEALKKIAKVIKESTMPVGKAARVGGDEFAMLLPEKNKREASHIAEEVRNKIESTNLLRDGKASVTVTGGISENPIDGATADELFKKALGIIKETQASKKNKPFDASPA